MKNYFYEQPVTYHAIDTLGDPWYGPWLILRYIAADKNGLHLAEDIFKIIFVHKIFANNACYANFLFIWFNSPYSYVRWCYLVNALKQSYSYLTNFS